MLPFQDDTPWLSTVICGLSHTFHLTSNRHRRYRIRGQSNPGISESMLTTRSSKRFFLRTQRAGWYHKAPMYKPVEHLWKYDARGTEFIRLPLMVNIGHSWKHNGVKAAWGRGWLLDDLRVLCSHGGCLGVNPNSTL